MVQEGINLLSASMNRNLRFGRSVQAVGHRWLVYRRDRRLSGLINLALLVVHRWQPPDLTELLSRGD
jgi:hypothetical protein